MSVLPKGWIDVSIGDITSDVSYGVTAKSDPIDGELKLLRITDIQDNKVNWATVPFCDYEAKFESSRLKNNDIVVARTGATVGKSFLIEHAEENSVYASYLIRLRLTDGTLPKYLANFLHTPSYWQQISEQKAGIGQPNVNGTKLKTLRVPLAPLPEQKRIVEKLDEVLAQVDTIKARLDGIPDLLKRFRQSVLASAVSGKLTEEWRRENSDYSTASMLDNFQELPKPARYNSRSTSFIQGVCATAVGKPEHKVVESWDWVPLVSIAKMESGHTPSRSKPEYWGGSVKWIGIKDARKNHANTISETEQRTNDLGLANSASRLLPKDTICISRTASVGYVVKMGEPMATSQDFVNWVPSEVVYPDWLKWLFVAEKESLFKFGRGSTHTTVYFPEWLALHISLPPLQEQKEIVRLVDQYFSFADTIEAQVKKAQARVDNLTQSILAKAFRGELVPQNDDDEPAEVLLERIAKARKEAEALAKAAKKAEAAKKRAANKARV
ncbi:restriction endonuclease subunit S [Vibrio parahaemolyticus]|uniref:restriction endonuclease subunit S n=1 Tax=Vibrio parahaemolyticus TaxID=670 RepID=UPI0006A5C0B8|nr:restriction endonuclease subunit S [Vibrio parahaemolyticus]EGQ8947280.1 type I restriction endonuclease subunit S [Vibrio parahaemolyticus]EGR3007728.1 type I restriction endonuclease subunit S [Vibrio parahaemolyticus]EGR3145172.1 type I restriction endonuclease subunit S [Vibrio parahaemolyticus]EGR3184107.1 type I restriction endonuclease subunit S [Vibrio parahaemolyticus]EGR3198501.1 type I restriction endonuclease subunit S [Vibrio parahaemolyticus]